MNLCLPLPWRRVQPLAMAREPVPVDADAGGAGGEPPPHGCGWFDSSHELQRGLCVRELATPEALARELPLAGWLEWQLAS